MMQNVQKVGGFLPNNMHGVDLSPKAIAINSEKHPEYNLKV